MNEDSVYERIDRKQDETNTSLLKLTTELSKVSIAQAAHERLDVERFAGITRALEVRRAWSQLVAGIVLGAALAHITATFLR